MDAIRPRHGAFSDRPVHDPLASLKEFRATRDRMQDMGSPQPRIGYACLWEEPPERSWSYSAWDLREGLRLVTDTIDIGVRIPRPQRTILRAIHVRRRSGRLTSNWGYS